MGITPTNLLPSPTDASPNDPPIHFDALNAQLDSRLNSRHADVGARESAITAPVTGQRCSVGNRAFMYRSGAWAKQGGPREVLYENGDVGNSGLVGASTSYSDIFTLTVTPPVAADTGHVHVSVGLQPSGSASTCYVQVQFAGVTYGQRVDCGLSQSTPVVIELPVTVTAGGQNLVVRLRVVSGGSTLVQHGAVRVTI